MKTHLYQSCTCSPPPTFPIHLLSTTSTSASTSTSQLSTFNFQHQSSTLPDESLPISPTNSTFLQCEPQAASANSTTLRPLSLSLSLSLPTPSLTRSNSSTSFTSVKTSTSSFFDPSTTSKDQSSSTESFDLNQLNSLLYQLASPNSSNSSSNPTTPKSRAERRARFQSLLSTFHAATVCKLDESNTSSLSSSLTELESNYPVAPNSVLQGIASSMTEPLHKTSIGSSELPSLESPGALILASKIAAPFQDAVRNATRERKEKGLPAPKLVGILATPSPPSVAYAEWTKKACQDVGIEFEIWRTWEDKDVATEGQEGKVEEVKDEDLDLEADVEDLIIAANADKSVHGIMVSCLDPWESFEPVFVLLCGSK